MQNFLKNSKNRGYALYTAIILTSLVMLVAYATANLSIKELQLSASSADSHIAFYNADAGLECALYWDLRNPNATPPGSFSAFSTTTAGTISCNGQNIFGGSQNNTIATTPPSTSQIGGGGDASPTSIFELDFSTGCVIVEVTKNSSGNTLIESRGYNSCSGNSRLERGIKIQY